MNREDLVVGHVEHSQVGELLFDAHERDQTVTLDAELLQLRQVHCEGLERLHVVDGFVEAQSLEQV